MKYSQLKAVVHQLTKCASVLSNYDDLKNHPALIAAEEVENNEVLHTVASALVTAETALQRAAHNLDSLADKVASNLEEGDIEAVASIAEAYENSNDPLLKKQADVLEQLLINFAQKGELEKFKLAQEEEIQKLKQKYRAKDLEEAYDGLEEQKRDFKAAERVKAVEQQIEKKRPLEASLSTRYCPDHPGTSVIKISDGVVQCPLDKQLYNYQEGFTTMKGNKIPGGTVEEQTQNLGDRALEQMSFSTRESTLNNK